MISACRNEISTRPAETDFHQRLHVEIKFRPGNAGQFSTWYLIRFACIFLGFFFVSMPFYKSENSAVCILFHKIRSSRSHMFFKIGVLKKFTVFRGKHQRWSLFMIKLQTWRPAKRLQHRRFPVNIAKFLRTPFLQSTSGGCVCKMIKFYKDI